MRTIWSRFASILRIDWSGMAVPARTALWLGLGLVGYGYWTQTWGLTIIGCVLVCVGVGLWLAYNPAPWAWPQKGRRFFSTAFLHTAWWRLRNRSGASTTKSSPPPKHAHKKQTIKNQDSGAHRQTLKDSLHAGTQAHNSLNKAREKLGASSENPKPRE